MGRVLISQRRLARTLPMSHFSSGQQSGSRSLITKVVILVSPKIGGKDEKEKASQHLAQHQPRDQITEHVLLGRQLEPRREGSRAGLSRAKGGSSGNWIWWAALAA